MASKAKLTNKEIDHRLSYLLQQLVQTQQAVNTVNTVQTHYIMYNDDVEGFKKYLEEKENESRKSDSQKSSKGNEKPDSGEQKTKTGKSKPKKSTK